MSEPREIRIRAFEDRDWTGVWRILEPIFRAGETYAVRRDIPEPDAKFMWTGRANGVYVATEETTGDILGTYFLRPNHEGPGGHVSNCGYAVSSGARGRGVATRMCEHSQREAASLGFRAMQFNFVAASNETAVRLWARLGFEIVGTLPGAFHHPSLGFVDAHVMFKTLATTAG